MIPRLIRKNLIECPKCKWKQDITNDICPMCDFKFTKQAGSNVNVYLDNGNIIEKPKIEPKFNLNKLGINIPNTYIFEDEKYYLRKHNTEFFKLIVDAENYNSNDLIKNFDQIISKVNSEFIKNEKKILSSSVREDLNSHEGFFTQSDKKKLKVKYKKSYFDYYEYFNIETSINKSNTDFINTEKNIMRDEFYNDLKNINGFITDSEREKFKKKYDKGYSNYYVSLNFGYIIDKRNEIEYNNKKSDVLNEFKEELSVRKDFITDFDRIQFRKKYTIYDYDYYDILDFDSFIDEFNKSFSENKLDSLQLLESYEPSIEEIISKIDCEIFSENQIEVEELYVELDELVESPIFDLFSMDLNDDETSKLIIKIKKDISDEKISGDISDILDFYFEQYKRIKKQILLNNFLNQYIISDDFKILWNSYNLKNFNIMDLVEKVRDDISNDDSMDIDTLIFKLEYYLKVELEKNEYFNKIDEINSKNDEYLRKYNLTTMEFNEILNNVQMQISQGYYIKDIEGYLVDKIKQKIDENRTESRIKLKKLVNNPDFIENNNLTQEKLEIMNERVGGLIFRNKIRSNDINEDFLLKQLRSEYDGVY